jgi:hypothetical protein
MKWLRQVWGRVRQDPPTVREIIALPFWMVGFVINTVGSLFLYAAVWISGKDTP